MKTQLSSKLFLLLLTLGPMFSFAQNRVQDLDLRPLLFKNFVKADIQKKDGSDIQASVDYNTNNQSIIFLKDDVYMELTGLEEIQEIKIDKSIFIPINGKFYEKTDMNNLFISYLNKVVVNDGVTSKSGTEVKNATESSNNVSNVYVSRNYQSANNLAFVKKFWVMKENQMIEVNNINKVARAFNVNKNKVSEFVKKEKLDLSNYDDVIILLNYVTKIAEAG
jgi:predicted XRE-type DNA-binding protein